MGKFVALLSESIDSLDEGQFTTTMQKRKFHITVTRKGEDKPHTYDAESYGTKKHVARHVEAGDKIHKIEDAATGEDVTADAKRRYARSRGAKVIESTQLDELSNEKVQAYKVAAKADKFEKANAARKGDKEAADAADKRQEGIDKANKRLATKAEGTEMGKFAALLMGEGKAKNEVGQTRKSYHTHKTAEGIVQKHGGKGTEDAHYTGFSYEHSNSVHKDHKAQLHHDLVNAGFTHHNTTDSLHGGEKYDSYHRHTTSVDVKHNHDENGHHSVFVYTDQHNHHPKHPDAEVRSESAERLEEGLRKVGSYEYDNRKATVHRDTEWDEYRVQHHVNGKHQSEADYHTDDKDDAHTHAKNWAQKIGEAVEPLEELSKETLRGYVVKATAKNGALGFQRGYRNGSDSTNIGSEPDKNTIKKQHKIIRGVAKATDRMLREFNEKAEEFQGHRSNHTGVVYHTDAINTNKLKDLKHGESKVIEAVHHDGYQLNVQKYEAHKLRNTIHLHDRNGDHVDSFRV